MKPHRLKPLIALGLALSSTACQDDPKLVEKREQQKAEIYRLKGELAVIDEKLKNLPPDVTDQLKESKALAEKQASEVASLESEVDTLEDRKRALQQQFDAYRIKYQAK